MQKIKSKLKINKGSVLAFTLIIMGLMTVVALGIAAVSVTERQSAGTGGKSTQSFQVADSGVETVIQKIKQDSSASISSVGSSCAGGVVSVNNLAGGNANITFFDNSDQVITDCDTTLASVLKVKSVSTYAQTSRAIEAAVAAEGDAGIGTCYNKNKFRYIYFMTNCDADGFRRCNNSELKIAAYFGCLPIASQYYYASPLYNCATDSDGEVMRWDDVNVRWVVSSANSCGSALVVCCKGV